MKIVEMNFEKDLLSQKSCEPFQLSDSHIILRGFLAVDFHMQSGQDSLIFHPLPDLLMESLDLIKKPSIIQQSSFVDLLDNLSANDSYTSLSQQHQVNKFNGKMALQDLKTDIDFTIVRDGRAQSIFENAKGANQHIQVLVQNQKKARPQSGKPAAIRQRPISGVSNQQHPTTGQRLSINLGQSSTLGFGMNLKQNNQRPLSGGIFRSFNSQQKRNMETNTTAAGTNSCVNIDVKAFNHHGKIISARRTNEIQIARKNYAVIKKTTMQPSSNNQRPKSAHRKVTERFQPIVHEEVPSFEIPYFDEGLKSSVNSQKVFNYHTQSKKALRAKKLSKQEDDLLNMILKQKIFQQRLNSGIHSGRVISKKTKQKDDYISVTSNLQERPVFHLQPKAVLPKPLMSNLGYD